MGDDILVVLPPALRRSAEAVAGQQGKTISDLIRDAVSVYIAEAIEDTEDVRAADEIEIRLAEGNEPVLDHADVWRDIDARSAEDDAPPSIHRRRAS